MTSNEADDAADTLSVFLSPSHPHSIFFFFLRCFYVQSGAPEGSNESLRAAVEAEAKKYVADHYHTGTFSVCVGRQKERKGNGDGGKANGDRGAVNRDARRENNNKKEKRQNCMHTAESHEERTRRIKRQEKEGVRRHGVGLIDMERKV